MALGGGTFTSQNKILPGAYINFVSLPRTDVIMAERGYASLALPLDWGADDEIFTVSGGDFQKNSLKIFGYEYTHEKLKPLREIFKNIHTLYCYKLGKGVKASCDVAEAVHSGICGNKIKISINKNPDNTSLYTVSTYFGDELCDVQNVKTADELTANDFVSFKNTDLSSHTGEFMLQQGTNGEVSNADHQKYLDRLESYRFNTLGVISDSKELKDLYTAFTKRMRDEVGIKFQCVLFNQPADYEGIVNVKNSMDLIPWVTGVLAGCPVNRSCLNRKYDGEYTVNCDFTQIQLADCIKKGEFAFHKVGNDIRVLSDINSLTTFSDSKGSVFAENQTVRVCDQIATDIADIFNNKYLGNVPNDTDGRIAFKNEILKHHQNLLTLRAIDSFSEEDIQVFMGDTKNSVVVYDGISIVNSMGKLYMTVKIA